MAYVIKLGLPAMNLTEPYTTGDWYLECSIQDSMGITADINLAKRFDTKVLAVREVNERESWQSAFAEMRTSFTVVEVGPKPDDGGMY